MNINIFDKIVHKIIFIRIMKMKPVGLLVSAPPQSQSSAYHLQCGESIQSVVPLVCLNALITHAIYDADRLKDDKQVR